MASVPALAATNITPWSITHAQEEAIAIRRYIPEPDMFTATRKRIADGAGQPRLTEIFSSGLLGTTVLASLVATGAQGGSYAITNCLPTYLKTARHLSVLNTGGYLAVVIIGSFAGYLIRRPADQALRATTS